MIRAALIGLGNIAWKYDSSNPHSPYALTQAKAILNRQDMQLCAGCSPSKADRDAFHIWSQGIPVFKTPEAMLSTIQPDFVGVCSPTHLHYKHTHLCIEKGVKYIWLEKPSAETSEQVTTLVKLARKQGTIVGVNFFRRYFSSHHKAKQLIQGDYAPCKQITLIYSPGLARNGIHLLDQLFYFTDAQSYKLLWVEQGQKFSPSFALRLSSGQIVTACGADVKFHTNDITLCCAGGLVSLSNGSLTTQVRECIANPMYPSFYTTQEHGDNILGPSSFAGHMDKGLEDILQATEPGCPPLSNLDSSLLSQKLLEEILVKAAL